MNTPSTAKPFHVALQFGHIKHFNEGLAEFSRQLALQFAGQAAELKATQNWHFHTSSCPSSGTACSVTT
jgi:hypothetical protein